MDPQLRARLSRIWNICKPIIGILLLVLLYSRLDDPAKTWQDILQSNKWQLALGALMYTLAVALSGIKWGILLRAVGVPATFNRLIEYQWLAEFFNNFLPAQVGGDVMRGFALTGDTQRGADSAASVLIDRFIGLMVFMIASAIASTGMLIWGRPDGSLFEPAQLWYMRIIAAGSVMASILLLAIIFSLLSSRLKEFASSILARLPLAEKLTPIWDKLGDAFNAYKVHPSALLFAAASSAVIVLLTSINIWLISQALNPGTITLLEVLAINPIIVFVLLALPISPGGLGVRQSVFAFTFGLMGANTDIGYAVGLLQQLIGYLVSLPGLYIWIRGRSHSTTAPTISSPPTASNDSKKSIVN